MVHDTQAVQMMQASKEAKSEDTKAGHQSPFHPDARSPRRHVGLN